MVQPYGSQDPNQAVQYQYDPEIWADYGLGTILRSFREAYGLTLYQVSDQLKIRAVYLQYLEDGQYDGLPGYAHGLGFLKAYAQFLGLPPEDMVRRYRNDTGVEEPVQVRPIEASPLQRFDRKFPVRTAIMALFALLFVGYLGSFLFNELNFGQTQAPTLAKRISLFFTNRDLDGNPAEIDPALGTAPIEPTSTQAAAAAAANGTPSAAPGAVTRSPTSGPSQPPPRILRSEDRPVLERNGVFRPQVKPNMALLVGDVNTLNVGTAAAALAGGADGVNVESPVISPLAVQVPETPTDDGTLAGVLGNNSGPIVIGAAPAAPPSSDDPPAAAPVPAPASGAETLIEPITITATAISWVHIRNANNELVRAAVLKEGESLEAPRETGLTISVESFDRISITVSGQQVPRPESIDPSRSVFPLDPERLRQGI